MLHAPRFTLILLLLSTFYFSTRHGAGEARAMHLHFVQSLEPLQGAGLGQAALSLHLAMRATHGEGQTAGDIRSEALNSEFLSDPWAFRAGGRAPGSLLT